MELRESIALLPATKEKLVKKINEITVGKKFVILRAIHGCTDTRQALRVFLKHLETEKPVRVEGELVASLKDIQPVEGGNVAFVDPIGHIMVRTVKGNERFIHEGERVFFADIESALCFIRRVDGKPICYFMWFTN
jgi:hypothetical protein